MMASTLVSTPLGPLHVTAQGGSITAVHWGAVPASPSDMGDARLLGEAAAQLRAYVEGRLNRFDLPLAPEGTAFQRAVWDTLADIPYAETWTYGQVADHAGGSPRAVGGACGRNPIVIIIPCHRVVGEGGRLTGYSGGAGVVTKAALLALEVRHTPARRITPPVHGTIGSPA